VLVYSRGGDFGNAGAVGIVGVAALRAAEAFLASFTTHFTIENGYWVTIYYHKKGYLCGRLEPRARARPVSYGEGLPGNIAAHHSSCLKVTLWHTTAAV
jgi:hypothetical protein